MKRRTLFKLAALSFASTAFAFDKSKIINTENRIMADKKNPTKFELAHSPEIIVSNTKDKKGYSLVEINVGQRGIIHPSDEKHWIYAIELYANNKKINSVELEHGTTRGYLACRVDLTAIIELKAISKCNLHGNWESLKKI